MKPLTEMLIAEVELMVTMLILPQRHHPYDAAADDVVVDADADDVDNSFAEQELLVLDGVSSDPMNY